LASSPSVILDQILAGVRQLRGWYHGASSLSVGRVCLLYLTLCWSLHYLTLWSLLCSTFYWSLCHLTLWSLLCSALYWGRLHLTLSKSLLYSTLYLSLLLLTLYWCLHHLTLWSLLCSTLCWSLHHLTLWSLVCSTPCWSIHHLALWSLLCSTLYWSLLVWVSLSLSDFLVWVSCLCPLLSVVYPVCVCAVSVVTRFWCC
jgi:hypothetical protein